MKIAPSVTRINSRLNGIDQVVESMRYFPFSDLIETSFGGAGHVSRRAVMFTSAEPKAGVSWIACAVAAELAASGRRVLLADAEVIASLSPAEVAASYCHRIGSSGIWVLGREQTAHTGHSYQPLRAQPRAALSELLLQYPHIVLDAPALSVSSVAVRFAPLVTGSVLVVRENKTETQELVKARDLLHSLGGTILGCVYTAH